VCVFVGWLMIDGVRVGENRLSFLWAPTHIQEEEVQARLAYNRYHDFGIVL